jgi:hypothetical protein
MTLDEAKNEYFRSTKHMAVKAFKIQRWDRLSREQREEEHARFERACSLIDREKV